MLLILENTNSESLKKLLAYAKDNKMSLSIVDNKPDNHTLPGKPLSSEQLLELIEKSRMLSIQDAHHIVRNNYHAD